MGQSLGRASEKLSSGSGIDIDGNGNDINFGCDICLDWAQDPVVTPCGHLFCWPCLVKWLRVHSLSQECPTCQALVQEEKLVPIYGKGKASAVDPRSKSVPGIDIPNRPGAQRPETARPAPNTIQLPPFGFDIMRVHITVANVTITPSSVDSPPPPTSQRLQDIPLKILLLVGGVVVIFSSLWF
ncbi:hypothetical protein MKW94_014692 [Papaver nudicaule]|uniref:E3 ubiquitin-protein ligase RMA n=1 Tax=Papaver nudicaule TaxID=74823 RepID=A0AA41RK37_PAPNU|nr:hypothetical protein [Papaver nudicaule]